MGKTAPDGYPPIPAALYSNEAALNMALDEALLERTMANGGAICMRLYHWREPAVTLGRFQNSQRTFDREACLELGVPVTRRITGGRGILHGGDLTVAIWAGNGALSLAGDASTENIYRRLVAIFIGAYRAVGMETRTGLREQGRVQERVGNCFETVAISDVVSADTGEKLMGSALHRAGRINMLQASLRTSDEFGQPRISSRLFPNQGASAPFESGARLPQREVLELAVDAEARRLFGSVDIVTMPDSATGQRALSIAIERYIDENWIFAR